MSEKLSCSRCSKTLSKNAEWFFASARVEDPLCGGCLSHQLATDRMLARLDRAVEVALR